MLSLDRDPRKVTAKELEQFRHVSSLAAEFFRRQMIALRVATDGGLSLARTRAAVFLRWMQAKAFEPPIGLIEAVERRGPSAIEWEEAVKEDASRFPVPRTAPFNEQAFRATLEANLQPVKDKLAAQAAAIVQKDKEIARLTAELAAKPSTKDGLSTVERNSLHKLVIGMAVAAYRFDPAADKSRVIPEIVADLEAVGISLSDDTVRKYLREAAEHLPPRPGKK
jgi:hypothetical protein